MARGIVSEFALEKDLEDAAVSWARARGWFVRKYRGAGRRSYPDRLFIRGGVCVFIEFKLPPNTPTPLQHKEIREMIAHGAIVYWIDDLEDLKAVLTVHGRSA